MPLGRGALRAGRETGNRGPLVFRGKSQRSACGLSSPHHTYDQATQRRSSRKFEISTYHVVAEC